MRIFNKFRNTKGFISGWQDVVRWRDMITKQAKERCRILAFREKHGDEAAKEDFKVSRRTLFRWQKKLKEAHGKLEGMNYPAAELRGIRKEDLIFPTDTPEQSSEEFFRLNKSSLSKDELRDREIQQNPFRCFHPEKSVASRIRHRRVQ